jgi:hypothetical protein
MSRLCRSGVSLNIAQACFNVFNEPLKKHYLLKTRMVGLGQRGHRVTPNPTIPVTHPGRGIYSKKAGSGIVCGIFLSLTQAPFKALNTPLKGRYSHLTRVVGFGRGARSRDPHQIHKSCFQGETSEGEVRGSCTLAACV